MKQHQYININTYTLFTEDYILYKYGRLHSTHFYSHRVKPQQL